MITELGKTEIHGMAYKLEGRQTVMPVRSCPENQEDLTLCMSSAGSLHTHRVFFSGIPVSLHIQL